MKWAVCILAAGLTVLAIVTLVSRLWPKSEIPVPVIGSAKVAGVGCLDGPERGVGNAEVSIQVPGGIDEDERLRVGIEGGSATSYDAREGSEANRLVLEFSEGAVVNSEIEVTATITRFDPGGTEEEGRTVTKRIPCEEIVLLLQPRIPDQVVRYCRRTLTRHEDRICELDILRSEGKIKPGPYTEREVTAAISRAGLHERYFRTPG